MASRTLEIIKKGSSTYGHLDGFLYSVSTSKGDVKYWKCRYRGQCAARLTTVSTGRSFLIRRGGSANSHSHEPNPEEVEALRIMGNIKRSAISDRARPPSAVTREAHDCDEAVQARLPEIGNIKKTVQRERLRHLPPNPTTIEDIEDIPETFTKTLVGDKFLMYDSRADEDYDSDRILVFATRENLRLLFTSEIWFLDGTFDTVPSIFFQLFTIMGSVTQTYKGTERKIAIPLVYALLENKKEIAYSKVIEVTLSAAEEAGIRIRHPQIVMTDFELAIINAVKNHFDENVIRLCFFHLRQSVYRKIQAEGLQQRYGDPNDNSIRQAARSMCALAYVPPDDVPEIFDLFQNEMPEDFIPLATYFEVNYVRGIRAIGRRKAVKVRYAPVLWNQYNSVLQGVARTNNASEGWHNRFQILVGRSHPSLYSFLTELQKEQADVEYMLREISLGKQVKKLPKSSQLRAEERIAAVVAAYQNFIDDENELEYLRTIGHHLNM